MAAIVVVAVVFLVANVGGDPYASERLLLVTMGVLLVVPVLSPLLRGRPLNPFEPIIVFLIAFAFFLFIRPAYILLTSDFAFIDGPYGGGRAVIFTALYYATLGLVCFYFGYYARFGMTIARTLSRPVQALSPWRSFFWGGGVMALGFVLYNLFLARSHEVSGNPYQQSTAYFYLGINLVSPALVFLLYWTVKKPSIGKVALFLALFLFTLYIYHNMGGRRWQLIYVTSTVGVAYYLFRGRLPSFQAIALGLLGTFLYIAAVGYGRFANLQVTWHFWRSLDISSVLQRFFDSSGDLIIFDAYTKILTGVPSMLPYQMGRSLLYIPQHFMPRQLWTGKPFPVEAIVGNSLFAGSGPVSIGSGYAYSMPGSFYVEGGLAGIVIGFVVFGFFCRMVWEYHQLHNSVTSQMLLAVTLPMILLSQRGGFNVNDIIWYLIHLAPVLIGIRFAKARVSAQQGEERNDPDRRPVDELRPLSHGARARHDPSHWD